jgi:uncharacterized membrane protein
MHAAKTDSSTGLPSRVAAPLAYSGWWVTGLVFWLVEERDQHVRFHAAQSIAAFGLLAAVMGGFALAAALSLLVLPTAFSPFIWALEVTWLAGVVVWALALWHSAHGRKWRISIAADLADRMMARRT